MAVYRLDVRPAVDENDVAQAMTIKILTEAPTAYAGFSKDFTPREDGTIIVRFVGDEGQKDNLVAMLQAFADVWCQIWTQEDTNVYKTAAH